MCSAAVRTPKWMNLSSPLTPPGHGCETTPRCRKQGADGVPPASDCSRQRKPGGGILVLGEVLRFQVCGVASGRIQDRSRQTERDGRMGGPTYVAPVTDSIWSGRNNGVKLSLAHKLFVPGP